MSALADLHRQGQLPLGMTSWRRTVDPATLNIRHPLAVPRQPVPAGAIPVTNCNDDGVGSLRDIVDNVAVSGDTIDLTNTGCSVITLTTGDIILDQDDIDLLGPGFSQLSIDGNDLYSVRHIGSGSIEIADLTIISGRKYLDGATNLDASGGCLYSYGSVSLINAEIKYCSASTANASYSAKGGAVYGKLGVTVSNSSVVLGSAGIEPDEGLGGGIYTPSNVILLDSFVSNSDAALGGGVFAGDGLVSKYSSIRSNSGGYGGGVYAGGNVAIQNSTIAGNSAVTAGGLWLSGVGATTEIALVNSTVSGNEAQKFAGVFTKYATRIANSTIAFNVEANPADTKYGAGFYTLADSEVQSTIIAQNSLNHSTSGLAPDDVATDTGVVLSGSNNLSRFVIPGSAMPGDTIYADPLLTALANHGGSTSTHALTIGSDAIDAGNNLGSFSNDQRGAGYPRVVGASADIGAVEYDPSVDDTIFQNGFD
ncbi:MAG: choice-of-anchor Q domain-containing protein [Rhodanobacteraceae bacterium]